MPGTNPKLINNTMTVETQNNDGQAVVACEVQQLKLSDVLRAMEEEKLVMDVPGLLIAADKENNYCWYEDDEENKAVSDIFRLCAAAFGRLISVMCCVDPEAWGVVATWAAKKWRAKRKMDEVAGLLNELVKD